MSKFKKGDSWLLLGNFSLGWGVEGDGRVRISLETVGRRIILSFCQVEMVNSVIRILARRNVVLT